MGGDTPSKVNFLSDESENRDHLILVKNFSTVENPIGLNKIEFCFNL